MSKLKVSIVTLGIRRYDSIAQMIAHLETLVARAADAGSQVVLFPEMGNVGLLWTDPSAAKLSPREVGKAYAAVLSPLLKPFEEGMSALARKHNITVIGPTYWHAANGAGANTAHVFYPDGEIYRQDKIHPTRPETAIGTVGGAQLATFDIAGIRAGLVICYDSQFPELTRHLANEGIQVLFVPSLVSHRGYWRVRYATQARAQENQLYVCVAAIFGDLGIPEDLPLTCHGGSYVTCPIDNRFNIENGLFAEAPFDQEGVLTAELDFDLLKLSRERGEIRNVLDRRPELYKQLGD